MTCGDAADVLASCLALLVQKSTDVAVLIERWNGLPDEVRASIVAMVNAAGGK